MGIIIYRKAENNMEKELNLCNEVIKEMSKLGFTATELSYLQSHPTFIDALIRPPIEQKPMLIMLFFKLLMMLPTPAPPTVRIQLNSASSTINWLEDMKLTIIPFLAVHKNLIPFFQGASIH